MTIAKKDAALATTPATKPAKSVVSNLVLGNADDALRLATELQKFVQANKLTSNIQGKEFPNVEAWQFAGGLLGLSSMLESIDDRSTDSEIKWHATVKVLHLSTGNVVGRGFATCSNKENTKKFFADYAIASMAQTRAVGKAYRLALGWLMKAAGYEATPAEEMQEQEVGTSATVVPEPKPTTAAPERVHVVGTVSTQAEIDKRAIDGHRTRFEQASTLKQVAQIWAQIPKHLAEALLADKEAAKKRFEKATAPQPVRDEQLMREFVEQPELGMGQPATDAQREEIKGLIDTQTILKGEKTDMLKVLYKLDEVRAGQAIFKIRNEIALREGHDSDGEWRKSLHKFIHKYAAVLTQAETSELTEMLDDANVHWQTIRTTMLTVIENMKQAAALAQAA